MTTKRKILVSFCLCFVLGLLALSGIGFYYYSNPSRLKPLAESALSRFTGTECSIKEISYSRHPLVIRAKGIQMIEHIRGFYLEIPEILANLSLEGSLGGRSLVFRDLRVTALSLSMYQGWRPPETPRDAERPSLFRRMLGGLFSFFLVRDVKIREARLEDGHLSGQWGDLTINVNGMHARLGPEQLLEVGCGLRLQSLPGQVDLKIPRFTLITDRPVYPVEAGIRARVKGEEMAFETPQGSVANALMEGRILFSPQDETIHFESLNISFDGMSLNEGKGARFVPLRSLVEARGSLDLEKASLAASQVHVVLGSIAEFRVQALADFQESKKFRVKVTYLRAEPKNLIPLLPTPVKKKLDPLTFTGSVLVNGRLDGSFAQDFSQWECDLQARLRENRLAFAGPAIRFETRVAGDVQARGPLSDLETQWAIHCDDSVLQARNAQFDRGKLHVSFSGAYPAFGVSALTIHVPSATYKMGRQEFLLEEIHGDASKGEFDVVAKTLHLPELTLHTSTLKNLLISTEITEGQLSARAEAKDVHLVDFAQAMRFFPPGWKIQSTDSLHAQAVLGADGHVTVTSKMEIQGLSFESPDGSWLGQNLSLVVEPTVEGTAMSQEGWNGSVFLYAREGEVLFDRFYLDLSRHALLSNGKGRYRPDVRSFELSDFRLQVENLATLTAQGSLVLEPSDTSRLRVHLSKAPLKPLFRQFVVDPFRHQNPFLNDLELNGFLSADLDMNAQDARWSAKGHAFWQEGEALLEGEGILLKGIDMDLPLWYQGMPKSTEGKRAARRSPVEIKGGLSIQSAQLPLLPAQPIDIVLKAAPNRVSTTSPLSLTVAGGQIDLGRIVVRDPFSGSPELDTRISVKKIDLGPWLSTLWPRPVRGSARGNLDPVRWEDGTLHAKGEIVATLFGGQVTVSNVGVSRSLSLAPSIHMDAAWEALNLADMTLETAFGKIEGTLRGHVKGLEIADGQPQRFDLFAETVKKKDVPQKISVRAVDNIAQIGGGASPFSGFTGAFVALFKELPYEKIGIKASLDNDVFRINGTIREGGREYLVKKGGFSGVDVIIGNPGSNTISFKDMVKRIRRVTASQERPVME